MQSISQKISKVLMRFSALALVVGLSFALPQAANAALSGGAQNTTLINVVTLSYNDAAATAYTATTSVTVTMELVSASPTVALVGNVESTGTTADTFSAGTVDYNYRVTNNSTGSEVITLAVGGTAGANTTLNSNTKSGNPTLGGTVLVSADAVNAGTQVINIAAGTLNGIIVGDIVVITGVSFQVLAVDAGTTPTHRTGAQKTDGTVADVAETTGFITIGIDNATYGSAQLPSITPGTLTGEQIGESIIITQAVTATTTNSTLDATVTAINLTATPAGGAALATDGTGSYTSVFRVPTATVTKYVRNTSATPANVTAGHVLAAGPITIDGNVYYASGVTGVPTDTLEYAIVVAGSTLDTVSAVSITDNFSVYTTGLTGGAGGIQVAVRDYTVTPVNLAVDVPVVTTVDTLSGGVASAVGTHDLTVNLGVGATAGAGGTMAKATTRVVWYTVTID